MIFGLDYSYIHFEDNTVDSTVKLHEFLPKSDMVTNTMYAFSGCSNIIDVTSYNYNENIVSYDYATSYITDYIIENIRYNTTYDYSYSFKQEFEGDLKVANSGYITNMNNMFSNCYSLQTVDLSYYRLDYCEDMSSMFNNCITLESIKFGNYYPSKYCNCENLFKNCESLSYVYIPYSLRNEYTQIIGQSDLLTYYYCITEPDYNPHIIDEQTLTNTVEIERYTTLTIHNVGTFLVEMGVGKYDKAPDFVPIKFDTLTITCKSDKGSVVETISDIHRNHAIVWNNKELNLSFTLLTAEEYEFVFNINDTNVPDISMKIKCNDDRYIDFDIDYIYFCLNGTQTIQCRDWQKPRVVNSEVRKHGDPYAGFGGVSYQYPDYNNLTVIDAKTNKKWIEHLANINTYAKISYIAADAAYYDPDNRMVVLEEEKKSIL